MSRKVSDVVFGPNRALKGHILLELKKDNISAQELIKKLKKAQSTVSEHLIELEKAKLIESKIDNKSKYYKLTGRGEKVVAALEVLFKEI
jgi:DNA-binding transcriptional ArsR family regulator